MTAWTLIDTLDEAVARLQNGEPIAAVELQYDSEMRDELRPFLETANQLQLLEPAPLPPPAEVQADRAAFLAQANAMLVSPDSVNRLQTWEMAIVGAFSGAWARLTVQRKEQRDMYALLAKAALVLAIVVSSLGGTAALSARSLPGSPAYAVKLALEDARLWLNADPAAEAEMHLEMVQARVQEMVRLAAEGQPPDDAALERLREHLALALHFAAQTNDDNMYQLLVRAQAQVQNQEQAIAQAQVGSSGPAEAGLQAAYRYLSRARWDAGEGVADPVQFRLRYGAGPPQDAPFGPGPGDCDGDCEPVGDEHKWGQDPENSGGPHGDCEGDCEPAGDENRYGQGPGDPDGPHGDCDGDCEPVGDEHKWGQDPEKPGGPHGGDQCEDECEPAGDENRYGQEGDGSGGPHGDCDGDCEPVGDQNGPQGDPPGPGQPGGNEDGNDREHGTPPPSGGNDGNDQPAPPHDENGNGGNPPPSGDNGGSPGDTGDNGGSPGDTGDNGGSPGDTGDNGGSPGDTGDNGGSGDSGGSSGGGDSGGSGGGRGG